MTTTTSAGCKINLYLYITALRDDGYHELDTLFLPLPEPADTLRIEPGEPGAGLTLTCSDPKLAGDSNLVARAYRAFAAASGFAPDLAVHLEKKSPIGAGLGGGSADCAAMLTHLNTLAADKALPSAKLAAIATSLGADVPFFLLGGPGRATGIGEVLTPVSVDMEGASLVLVTPPVHVSTPWAYRAWDELREMSARPKDFLTGLGQGGNDTVRPLGMALENDFERVVFPAHPELAGLKKELLQSGAAQAVMSGSGAALFGLFPDRNKADGAAHRFRERALPAFVFHY